MEAIDYIVEAEASEEKGNLQYARAKALISIAMSASAVVELLEAQHKPLVQTKIGPTCEHGASTEAVCVDCLRISGIDHENILP